MSDSEDFEVTYKDHGLKNLIKALKEDVPMAHVGVLGSKNARRDGNTNAAIGYKHEFGIDVPRRSWLREPITANLEKYLEEAGAFDEDTMKMVLKTGSLKFFITKIGIVAERIVADGFETGGFGKWQPSNMRFKKNHQTLVETQQLRNAVTSEVK